MSSVLEIWIKDHTLLRFLYGSAVIFGLLGRMGINGHLSDSSQNGGPHCTERITTPGAVFAFRSTADDCDAGSRDRLYAV